MTGSTTAPRNGSIARATAKIAAPIEALLEEVDSEMLTDLWQEACPFPVDNPGAACAH